MALIYTHYPTRSVQPRIRCTVFAAEQAAHAKLQEFDAQKATLEKQVANLQLLQLRDRSVKTTLEDKVAALTSQLREQTDMRWVGTS